MTNQTTLLNLNENAGNKRYRFAIVTDGGGMFPIFYELEFAPDGWKDEITFVRNEKYKGVFRSYSSNELKFPKDGRNHLKNLYESKGITIISELFVWKWDNENFEFVQVYEGKIDFSTYKIDELFVSVQVVDNATSERVKNRDGVEVDLLTTDTIDGGTMPAFAPKNEFVVFPTLRIIGHSEWSGDNYQITTGEITPTVIDNSLQLDLGFSEIEDAVSQTKEPPITSSDFFYENSTGDTEGKASLSISGDISWHTAILGQLYLRVVVVGASSGDVILFTTPIKSNAFSFDYNVSSTWFDITAGDRLKLEYRIYTNGSTQANTGAVINITETDFKFEVVLRELDQHIATALPYYEGFLRVCQKILNRADCFRSGFFGRTDSEITTYATDGQLGHITKGQLIRDLDQSLTVSWGTTLEKMFESLSSVFNLGLGIEEVGGVQMVRVENLAYFFDNNIVLDLSDRISEAEIGKEILPDWHYAHIDTGYKKYEYELTNGIFEYNCKQSYATAIDSLASLNSKLDIISDFRADTNGIIVLREEYRTDNSDDVDGDDDTFMVDTIREITHFIARTDEDFRQIVGTIDSDEYYNYDYTPKRNMLRHGMNIRAGLERNLNSYVTFQTTDKIVYLSTRLDSESENVTECESIRVNDLDEPMWWAEAYTIECPFFLSDLKLLQGNPRGIIKLSDTKFGWVLEIKTNNEDKAELKLLRVNTNYVTPV